MEQPRGLLSGLLVILSLLSIGYVYRYDLVGFYILQYLLTTIPLNYCRINRRSFAQPEMSDSLYGGKVTSVRTVFECLYFAAIVVNGYHSAKAIYILGS